MTPNSASCNFYNQLGAPVPVKLSLLPNQWAVCTYASTLRSGGDEGDTLDMTFPERLLVTAHMAGHKLELHPYHGRDTLTEELDDWGTSFEGTRPQFDAALVTSTQLSLVTYASDGTWTTEDFPIKEGCLEYQGKFYGDFSLDLVVPA